MDKSYDVEIFGSAYKLKGDGADREYIESLSRYVDKKMWEVYNNTPTGASIKVAVLAAINIANELFKVKKNISDKEIDLSSKYETLIAKISDVIDDQDTS